MAKQTMKQPSTAHPENTQWDWTSAQVQLITETVAQNATEDELRLFLYTAKARGLDPLLKQIHLIKRKQKRGDRWVEVGTVQTGIDGFRLIANRTQKLRGIERGTKRDEKNKLYAWARVWRKDWDHPAYEEVSLEEYRADSALWVRMPEQMLKKCAEVAALRMAFPEDLSGIYAHEEMDQADKSALPVSQERDKTMSKPIGVTTLAEADTQKMKDSQKAMKQCLSVIQKLQQEHNLTKEDIQWATGLETFKGLSLEAIEKAVVDLIQHCQSKDTLPVAS